MFKKSLIAFIILIIIAAGMVYWLIGFPTGNESANSGLVRDYNDCISRGYPVTEGKPSSCRTPNGVMFYEEADDQSPDVCIQVITPAVNPETGERRDFPTPCDVPAGWTVQTDACPQVSTRAINPQTQEEKDFPSVCDIPEGWVTVASGQ